MRKKPVFLAAMTKKAIAYYRVSTERQGASGLGLEAQQEAVSNFISKQGFQIVKVFTEIESGNKNKRPQLLAALQQCKKEKATLIIAKLDRLGRNVAFIANLMESRVDFVAVDNPEAKPLILHILAAFAQHEREQISVRTKDALKAAKRRGVLLGQHGRNVLSKKNKETAKDFAQNLKPIIEELQAKGITTVRAITSELNQRKVSTYRNEGQKWHIPSVHKLLKRLQLPLLKTDW